MQSGETNANHAYHHTSHPPTLGNGGIGPKTGRWNQNRDQIRPGCRIVCHRRIPCRGSAYRRGTGTTPPDRQFRPHRVRIGNVERIGPYAYPGHPGRWRATRRTPDKRISSLCPLPARGAASRAGREPTGGFRPTIRPGPGRGCVMLVYVCDECGHGDQPCRLDGGDAAGDPLVCPWCPSCPAVWHPTEGGIVE